MSYGQALKTEKIELVCVCVRTWDRERENRDEKAIGDNFFTLLLANHRRRIRDSWVLCCTLGPSQKIDKEMKWRALSWRKVLLYISPLFSTSAAAFMFHNHQSHHHHPTTTPLSLTVSFVPVPEKFSTHVGCTRKR